MIRATLDVNVLVSGFPAVTGTPSELLARWSDLEYELVSSEHIVDQLADAWDRPYWRTRYSANKVQATMRLHRVQATFVAPDATVRGVADDEEDDLVLATAVAGNADFLVTGDKYLQRLGRYRDIQIFSSRQFLDLLDLGATRTA